MISTPTRLLFFLVFTPFILLAQTDPCGQFVTEEQRAFLTKQQDRISLRRSLNTDTIFVPILFHRIADSLGQGAVTVAQVDAALDYLNELYESGAIVFERCEADRLISSNEFYDYEYSEEFALRQAHEVSGVINIFIPDRLASSSGSQLCGYAYLPPTRRDICMVKKSCFTNGTTLAHEVGHYLGLYHTHGKSNCGSLTDELADGSNCSTTGDDVCDTPADPNLLGSDCTAYEVDRSCVYTGTRLDANNMPFSPDTRNIMSYSRKACREYFSAGQLDRMRFFLETSRSYLECTSCANAQLVVSVDELRYLGADFSIAGQQAGASIDVEYSRNGGPYNRFRIAQSTFSLSSLAPCDSVTIRVREVCPFGTLDWSTPFQLQTAGCATDYCVQAHYAAFVNFSSLSVDSNTLTLGPGVNSYQVLPTAVEVELEPGDSSASLSLTATGQLDDPTLPMGFFQVWFDENNDKEFSPNEQFGEQTFLDGELLELELPIGPNTPRDTALRLRIYAGANFYAPPCESELGQTVDVNVIISERSTASISWASDTLLIGPAAQTVAAPFASNVNWMLTGDEIWATPVSRAGDASSSQVAFDIERNTGCMNRVGAFTLVHPQTTARLVIIQQAVSPEIEAIPSTGPAIHPAGEELSLETSSMHNYSIRADGWVADFAQTGLLDRHTTSAFLTGNDSGLERTDTILIEGCGVSEELILHQEAAQTAWASTDTLHFIRLDETLQVEVESNVDWSIESSDAWLEIDTSSQAGFAVLTASLLPNAPTGAVGYFELAAGFGAVNGERRVYVTTPATSSLSTLQADQVLVQNPFGERLEAGTTLGAAVHFDVLDARGRLLTSYIGHSLQLDTSDWPSGLYVLRVRTETGTQQTRTLVKR